jgi:DNA-binding IclR family transcriptional regulator
MLGRLVRRSYVARNDNDRYELALKLFGLAHLHRPIRRLVAQAAPLMRDLAKYRLQFDEAPSETWACARST